MDRHLNRAKHLLDMQDMHLSAYQAAAKAIRIGFTWARTDNFQNHMVGHLIDSRRMYRDLDEVCDAVDMNDVWDAINGGCPV